MSPEQVLRSVLLQLPKRLEREYSAFGIMSEADMEAVIVDHLKSKLVSKNPKWVVGANHSIGRYRPDVTCYFNDDDASGALLDDRRRFVVGLIEIKWASNLGRDLSKLSALQQSCRGALAWMVYGDHFDALIHRAYAREQNKRAARIASWVSKAPEVRGETIFKAGLVRAQGQRDRSASALDALRRSYWLNDKNARAAEQQHAADGAPRRR